MNTNTKKIVGFAAAGAMFLSASSALALTVTTDTQLAAGASVGSTSVGVSAALTARITKAKDHADKEIDRRVAMLNDLNTKIQAMARVSADEKTAISGIVSAHVTALAALKTKIDGENDIATLKPDIQAITQSYRIFMLIVPRVHIDVAADKVDTAAAAEVALAAKLQTRIADAQTAGKDVTALSTSLTEMNAKAADAKVQADAAVAEVVALQPDNGDKAVQTKNNAALKDARAKIKVALEDLKTARKDAGTIVSALKKMDVGANASSSASVSTH